MGLISAGVEAVGKWKAQLAFQAQRLSTASGPPNPSSDFYKSFTLGYDGEPMGPDNNMIHYHARYIGEDKMRAIGNSKVPVFDIVVTIDPDYGMSAVPGD